MSPSGGMWDRGPVEEIPVPCDVEHALQALEKALGTTRILAMVVVRPDGYVGVMLPGSSEFAGDAAEELCDAILKGLEHSGLVVDERKPLGE